MLHPVESLGQHTGDTRAGALARDGLAAMLALAVCCGPALAGEPPSAPEDQARSVADEVLRRAGSPGPEGLGGWTNSVIGRALERAGEAASETAGHEPHPQPLPAERRSGALAELAGGRDGTGEVLVFVSLSVPVASWRQWAREVALIGAPLVLRGVGAGGLPETAKRIGGRLDGNDAGVAIDPRLFRLFGVERVPAVVVVPKGVGPCASRGCADEAPPPFDRVTGNVGLVAALEAIAAEGDAGRDVARASLERLRGED